MKRKRPRAWWLAWTSVTLALILGLLLRVGGDRWWPVFPLLFGPRWIALVLILGTLPLIWSSFRHGTVPLLLTVFLVVVGFMGWHIGWARFRLSKPTGIPVRVVEYNVAGSYKVAQGIADRLDSLHADIALLAECPSVAQSLHPLPAWQMASTGELCLLSRYPIRDWNFRSQDDIWRLRGKLSVASAEITIDGTVVKVGLLHLKSARDALMEFRSLSFRGITHDVDSISEIRNIESGRAVAFLDAPESMPVIVGGDFNTPAESTIWRRWWSGYTDAFMQVGVGFGYSWHSRWHGIRIDHILIDHGIRAVGSSIGPDLGSDHVPVIADLVLPGRATSRP